MTGHLFALERYDDTGGEPAQELLSPPALPPNVRLAAAVYVAADDCVLMFVEGESERSVRDAVTAAGWRFDRITAAWWVAPALVAADGSVR